MNVLRREGEALVVLEVTWKRERRRKKTRARFRFTKMSLMMDDNLAGSGNTITEVSSVSMLHLLGTFVWGSLNLLC